LEADTTFLLETEIVFLIAQGDWKSLHLAAAGIVKSAPAINAAGSNAKTDLIMISLFVLCPSPCAIPGRRRP
jgi:hypothetical protein